MKFLDLKIGVLTGKSQEFGFTSYRDLDAVKKDRNLKYRVVDLRACVLGLIGSSYFSSNQKTSINRLYDEYVDDINVSKYEKYIMKNKELILPTSSISHVLKLYILLEYALDFDICTEYIDPNVIKGMMSTDLYFNLEPFKVYSVNKKSVLSKIAMSVFKKVSRKSMEYGKGVQKVLLGLINIKGFTFSGHDLFGLFGYAYSDIAKTEFGTTYYAINSDNKKLADNILSKFKKVSTIRKTGEELDNILDLCKKASSNTLVKFEDMVQTVDCILFSIENIGKFNKFSLETITDIQLFSNVCAQYNLSGQMLELISNKKELMEKSLYLASNFYKTEEDIITKGLQLYYKLALLQFVKERHDKDIEENMKELIRQKLVIAEKDKLKMQLSALELKVSNLTNELHEKQTENNIDTVKNVHKEYYGVIKDLTKTIEKLGKEVNSLKVENNNLKGTDDVAMGVVEERIKNEVDLSNKNILVVGHFGSLDTIDELRKRVKNCDFIDGTVKSNTISANQVKKYDLLLVQYQFVPHTVKKFSSVAKKAKVEWGYLEGTNIEKWETRIKELLSN